MSDPITGEEYAPYVVLSSDQRLKKISTEDGVYGTKLDFCNETERFSKRTKKENYTGTSKIKSGDVNNVLTSKDISQTMDLLALLRNFGV